jgi:hypothetical protein
VLDSLEYIDGLRDLALYSRRPLPFPLLPPADFLASTYLTRDEARVALASLPPVELAAPLRADWQPWDEPTSHVWCQDELKRMQFQYRQWLEMASHTERDVVAFAY